MLQVNDIHKTYEESSLLEGVSFIVNPGETVCLLGPSGSGKSTLLRIIAGLEQTESGVVFWDKKDLQAVPAYQRHFGLMFQDYALFPHRTVAQNVAFGLRMQKLPTAEVQARTNQALETIDMLNFAQRRVTDLSGGEQQRVALARALAPNPRLLMLDEPLGALDRALREQLSRELRHILHNTCIPAIYVTHDQDEAFATADRLLILHNGKIIQSGTPEEIYNHPNSLWVARFFGLGNLLEGCVISHNPLTLQTALGPFQVACQSDPPPLSKKLTLLLRPSAARICTPEQNLPNMINGVVQDAVFQGDSYRLRISCQAGIELFLNLAHNIAVNSQLELHFPPKTILCLT
ncbi:MAG: ABC transporter ATP-binding protein [Chloroflexota bacterium]